MEFLTFFFFKKKNVVRSFTADSNLLQPTGRVEQNTLTRHIFSCCTTLILMSLRRWLKSGVFGFVGVVGFVGLVWVCWVCWVVGLGLGWVWVGFGWCEQNTLTHHIFSHLHALI